MPKKIMAGIAVLLVLGGLCAYKLMMRQTAGITATGTIEITRADITSKVSGYLDVLDIKEGDRVTAGQKVAKIGRPDLEAQLLRDEAALSKAKVQLNDLEKGARAQEIEEAAMNVKGAQAVYDKAKADYERFSRLFKDGAVSAQQMDAAQSAFEVARNTLAAYQARASLVEEGSREDVVAAQRKEVERSEAVVKLSRSALDDTVIKSPLGGVVLTKNFEPGEFINAGAPIATIGDLSDCWVKVYVSSAQLGLIKLGQQVTVKVDSFPDRVFGGTIKEISQNAEFTPRQSITQQERANLVFRVKVKVDNADGLLKPGMPADVVFQ